MGRRINRLSRKPRHHTAKPIARPRSRLRTVEQLEPRNLLAAVTLQGIPTWFEEGPRPMINGGSAPFHRATLSLAPCKVSLSTRVTPAQIYVATVNGGVWKTNNAEHGHPWDHDLDGSMTDLEPSLATGSIAFSPLDATRQTLFVGTGTLSNLTGAGGPAVGIYRTTDGGATWSNFRGQCGQRTPHQDHPASQY